METEWLILAGIALTLIGIVAVVAGTLLSSGDADVRGGGVIFLGPIPIVFGSDKKTALAAFALGLLVFAAYYLFWRRP